MGTLNAKKNRLFLVTLSCAMGLAHGKVCTIRRVPGGGTRRTDHPLPCAAGPGTRRTNYLRRVPEIVAHGEFIPTLSGSGHAVFLFFCTVYLDKHTAKLFAVCPKFGTRQTQPLPCLLLPSALRRARPSSKSSPCARGASPCAWGTRQSIEIR